MLKPTKQSDIQHHWDLIDAKDQILGRLATAIAVKLVGKYKPYFVRHLDCGDHVVVVNAKEVRVTGRKETQKIYTRFSGYPGGLKKFTLAQMRETNPTEIIRHAVAGMLPNNKLKDRWLTRLHIYTDDKHPYQEKFSMKIKNLIYA